MKLLNNRARVAGLAVLAVCFQVGAVYAELSPRIVDGGKTQQNAETGSLLIDPDPFDATSAYQGICSGTLIGCQTFLTAAHCICSNINPFNPDIESFQCIQRDPGSMRVYLQNGGIYPVSSIAVDPSLNLSRTLWQGDIAVLTLANPVLGIPPAAINTLKSPPFDTTAAILGFGLTGDLNGGSLIDNYGIKFAGTVTTKDCDTLGFPLLLANQQNICWQHVSSTSDTCKGDSGGPLFIDAELLGGSKGKVVVAGVTAAGDSDTCQSGISWDANVFFSQAFIQKQTVGQLTSAGICRKAVRGYARNYLKRTYTAMRKCQDKVNAGKLSGTCPGNDKKTQDTIDKAISAISLKSIARNCPDSVLQQEPHPLAGGACAGVATGQALQDCIKSSGDTAMAQMLSVEYASPVDELTNADPDVQKAEIKCQKGIVSASSTYLFSKLNSDNDCQLRKDSNKLVNTSDCPDDKAVNKNASLTTSAQKKYTKACTQTALDALLNGHDFTGCSDATTVDKLINCQLDEHNDVEDVLVKLALGQTNDEFTATSCGAVSQVGESNTLISNQDQENGINKAPGIYEHVFVLKNNTFSVLRITLNGAEDAGDIDLYVYDPDFDFPSSYSTPPTTSTRSTNVGTFEAVEISNPETETDSEIWHVLVVKKNPAASTGKDYQLTITALTSD